jgi:hypothetical protein
MSNTIPKGISIEPAVVAFLLANYAPLAPAQQAWAATQPPEGHESLIGGDMAFLPAMPFYIRVDKVPGSRADRFGGDYIVDVEVFSVNYLDAESRSLDIEALLLGYPHVVEVGERKVLFDEVSQNTGPDELPWEDDEVSRLGATYVITARRR